MSVKVKPGMYCPRCKRPVLAQRTGHAVRNTAAVGGAFATLGVSLLALKGEKWACPFCGGKVQTMTSRNSPSLSTRLLPQPRTRSNGRTWRCEKNGHVLNKKRKRCPIDGSPAGWVAD